MADDAVSILEFEKPILDIETKIEEFRNMTAGESVNFEEEIKSLQEKRDQMIREIFATLTPWQRVQIARHPKRPHTMDYIQDIFTDFIELHGDRAFADDQALVGGLAFLDSVPVVVMGQQKGRNVEESMSRNFGMMHPEGYRKALRLMKLAEKFNRTIITFIDTPGAYPGIGAEERGQAEAIARNLREMSVLKVPVISVVIGEGGSGGALGIGVSDRILMLENAWYSVISPEGCAAILFRDAARSPDAAKSLKLTAQDLLEIKVIDEMVPEPAGGAHSNFPEVSASLKKALLSNVTELKSVKPETLVKNRYQKYRKLGAWTESKPKAAAAPKPRSSKVKKTVKEAKS